MLKDLLDMLIFVLLNDKVDNYNRMKYSLNMLSCFF